MVDVVSLARPEIRALKAYVPASYSPDAVRLNANESPWRCAGDETPTGMNRYPAARPQELAETLARHFNVDTSQLFVTRGTSEAIDLLIRCFCRPSIDSIVISPPTFGMYEVYADLQGAPVRRVPLLRESGYSLPTQALIDGWCGTDRLVFVTTPNNPTGNQQSVAEIDRLAEALAGRGVVVVDAAYIEFGDEDALMQLAGHENIVILRTLSKAYGLAGVRCGCAIAAPGVIELMARAMPPYAVPTPSNETALAVMAEASLATMPSRIEQLLDERTKLSESLAALDCVRTVWPSDANFVLVEFADPAQVLDAAAAAGLLLRDFSASEWTPNCLRISVGTPEQNQRLIEVVSALPKTPENVT